MSVFDDAVYGGAVRCSEEDYDYALGVVPPEVYLPHGFVMGEPKDYSRWYCFWNFEGSFWCMLISIEEAESVISIDDHGIGYRVGKVV